MYSCHRQHCIMIRYVPQIGTCDCSNSGCDQKDLSSGYSATFNWKVAPACRKLKVAKDSSYIFLDNHYIRNNVESMIGTQLEHSL